MLAHVLALHLALLDPAAAPVVHVLPPLELSGPNPALADAPAAAQGDASPADAAAAKSERPADAGPLEAPAQPRRGSVLAGYGGGLVGTVAADLVFVGIFALSASNVHFLSDSSSDGAWAVALVTSGIGLLFVTPVATVWGAQRAEGYERPGLAYAAVFAVRLAGFLAAAGFPPILLATELVAAPLVAAAVAASGTPIGRRAASPPDFPDESAPRPDAGPGGPPISRPLCPDAAFALR